MRNVYYELKGAFYTLVCILICSMGNDVNAQIACNNLVQVSLDDQCQVIINDDMILEGSYTHSNFAIKIEGLSGVTITQPGTYGVTVTDLNDGNSCWGKIQVEDKLSPTLLCLDQKIPCSNPTNPGAKIVKRYKVPGAVVGANAFGSSVRLDFVVNAAPGATVDDIDLSLNIDHGFIPELSATLKAPGGQTYKVFSNPLQLVNDPNCLKKDLIITFDDEATDNNAMLQSPLACRSLREPSVSGKYKPEQSFDLFNNLPANGTWTLIINDSNLGSNTGSVISSMFRISVNEGVVSYPTLASGSPTFTSLGGNKYRISGLGTCQAIEAEYEDVYTEECGEVRINNEICTYFGKIVRCWYVKDGSGNTNMCCGTIYIERGNFDLIEFPPNYDGHELPSFSCPDEYAGWEEPNGAPSPHVTGSPYDYTTPAHKLCGHMQSSYTDLKIDICARSFKILRTWTILDWCTSRIYTHDQLIKVVDDMEPIVNSPLVDCTEVPITDPYSCEASFVVPPPNVIFECNTYKWKVVYLIGGQEAEQGVCCDAPADGIFVSTNVVYSSGNGYVASGSTQKATITGLPLGCTWIKYIVEDACGNISDRKAAIEIKVVDDIPPIAVCDEFTVVSVGADGMAKVFAETFDDGSWDNCMIDSFAVRRMDRSACDNATNYKNFVKFCCNEVGKSFMVEFLVVDKSGNSNTCMVEVTVQDKLPPYFSYCPPDVSLNCHEDYTDLDLTGRPTVADNCTPGTPTYTDTPYINQCGVGYVRRVWQVADGNGIKNAIPCVQIITLVDNDPFTYNKIGWPNDRNLTSCGANTHPDVTGYPNLGQDDICSLVAATWNDLKFEFVDGACLKIIREWTVIDWCTYDHGTRGIWSYTQVIKVNNTQGPVFTSSCSNRDICGYGPGCNGNIELKATATDECTAVDKLKWWYEIDLGNDNVGTLLTGSTNDASGVYPYGTHRIKWSVEDRCGNVTTCQYLFTVKDCKAPTPYCYTSVTSVVMPSVGSIAIWAKDFNLNSDDNCTPKDQLRYSFSSNVNNTNRVFTCADISNGQRQTISLQMWVTDLAGNQDFCEITLELQDNAGNVCPDVSGLNSSISGNVMTEEAEMITNVDIELNSASQLEFPKQMISLDGQYAFSNLPMGFNYNISSYKNDDPINGVSTLDLVMIQKHILGLTALNSPYKLIAADIDNSQHISAADLVHLRKLILGVTTEFPTGQKSWRFVDASQQFANPSKPFPFVEVINVSSLNQLMVDVDFMGIKIGDVNASAKTNQANSSEVRSNAKLVLETAVQSGANDVVSIRATEFNDIVGMQYTLSFNANDYTFAGINSGLLSIDESNLGLQMVDRGLITLSWNTTKGMTIDENEALFSLVFKAKSANSALALNINSGITKAEAYTDDMEVMSVELRNQESSETFELYQNNPNPFDASTMIAFRMPKAGKASLSVYDVTGRVVYRLNQEFAKGYNEVQLQKTDLGSISGVLYYSLETDGYTATKKMIGIK